MNGQGYGLKTLNEPSQPFNFEDIIRDAIINAIWNGELSTWDSATGTFGDRALARDFTPNEIYIWVNKHSDKIDYYTGSRHREYFHKNYSHNDKRYIDVLKAIVIGRKKVLDNYKAAKEVTPSEIDALEQKFKLPVDIQKWLNEHKQLLTEDEKRLFNIQSADSGAGTGASAEATADSGADAGSGTSAVSSAETTSAGGRRRRKTSFRRRRMSRCRSSKSKSKSKKSRKSRKCVR